MKGITTEAKVGVAVLVGLLLLTYMTFKVGGFAFLQEEGYRLKATFSSASGLDRRAPVRVAGVEVGQVESIELVEGGAKVILKLQSEVKIRKGDMLRSVRKGFSGIAMWRSSPVKKMNFGRTGRRSRSRNPPQTLKI
ncbi:MAG: MlaD family protein [Candidatus Manganitrophus sp.]|nr:MAG: MlaD family protein [Candidatus Manganitrophus sp.]